MPKDGRSCLFQDIMDRLEPKAREYILQAVPAKSSPKDEKAAAYKQIEEWLHKNIGRALPAERLNTCLLHDRKCPVHRCAFERYLWLS